jgi:hypothetical protein
MAKGGEQGREKGIQHQRNVEREQRKEGGKERGTNIPKHAIKAFSPG